MEELAGHISATPTGLAVIRQPWSISRRLHDLHPLDLLYQDVVFEGRRRGPHVSCCPRSSFRSLGNVFNQKFVAGESRG